MSRRWPEVELPLIVVSQAGRGWGPRAERLEPGFAPLLLPAKRSTLLQSSILFLFFYFGTRHLLLPTKRSPLLQSTFLFLSFYYWNKNLLLPAKRSPLLQSVQLLSPSSRWNFMKKKVHLVSNFGVIRFWIMKKQSKSPNILCVGHLEGSQCRWTFAKLLRWTLDKPVLPLFSAFAPLLSFLGEQFFILLICLVPPEDLCE